MRRGVAEAGSANARRTTLLNLFCSLSLSLYHSLSLSPSLHHSLSLSLTFCECVCLFESLFVCVFPSVYECVCVCVHRFGGTDTLL